jgi:CRISPR-associated endonuclease/helicase Cas3
VPFDRLLAKSGRGGTRQTILQHTALVLDAAEALVTSTGLAQLRALGLALGVWEGRLWCAIRAAALLHDLGKANDHFQGMIRETRPYPQALRHEAVSFWIATRPQVRRWLAPHLGDDPSAALVLWAIAGHHRKFPPPEPRALDDLQVLLSHPDFREVLARGAGRLGLGAPPEMADQTLRFQPSRSSVLRELEDAHVEADALFRRLTADEKRFLALLKGCLIGADVAGSIGRRGGRMMADWIAGAFANVPSAGQLEGIVRRKLEEIVRRKLGAGVLNDFQRAVGARAERVVFVRAGCGSGKTLAAYHWAARLAGRLGRGLRLFFCYPTMGTATEGYRDYLVDEDLDAALVHGRAEVDMELLGLGDQEPDAAGGATPEDRPGRAAVDSAGALDQWSTPLVSCTVDTVLGLLQNHRRGLYAWPSIAGAAVVFDEVHAYDEALFEALLRFLAEVPGVPCLLMTASLPAERLGRIRATLGGAGEALGEVAGPEHLERLRRYHRDFSPSPWDRVRETLDAGGKVLWVVNTVDEAMALAADRRAEQAGAILYHSRFRYLDRFERHKQVIAAFRRPEGVPAFAITTQVAEMSLDLSADLLVTHLAPIAALIQRLGRLHRRAEREDPLRSRPFLVYEPDTPLPYEPWQLDEARAWLDALGAGPISQADLVAHWAPGAGAAPGRRSPCIWLDGGFVTEPRPLREASPGIEVILGRDRAEVEAGRRRPGEVRIPMPVPKDPAWRQWDEVAFCKVPPHDRIDYDETRGARWVR